MISTLCRNLMMELQNRTNDLYKIGDPKEYTSLVLEEILPSVARNIGYDYVKEYPIGKVDFTLMKCCDSFTIPVALIEHENNGAKAYEEVQKLVLLSAKYKILITYLWHDESNVKKYLTDWEAIVRAFDQCNEVGATKEFFLFIGAMDPYKQEDSINPGKSWSLFKYRSGSFVNYDLIRD